MSQWDQHTRFLDRTAALKELNDLKFAVESLAALTEKGSFANENAKNIVTGLRTRIDYLKRSFELLLDRPAQAVPPTPWQIPKGPFEAQRAVPVADPNGPWQAEKAVGESIMEIARRQIEAAKQQDRDPHPYVPEGRGRME